MTPPKAPLHNNPWDVAPILDTGDPEETALFTAVGTALTAWEKLDQVQARVFGILVGSRRGAAVAAYGTIIVSSGRSEMVDTAARVVLSENIDLLNELTDLLGEIGKLIGRRNDIAHGVVSHFEEYVDGALSKDRGHFLVPASYATRKRARPEPGPEAPMTMLGKYAYTSAQVMAYAEHFNAYYLRLVRLMHRIGDYCDAKWPPPKPQLPS